LRTESAAAGRPRVERRHRTPPWRAGKLPKVALVACMRKLLTNLNAMVRTKNPWDSSLHHA
jgi:transposase